LPEGARELAAADSGREDSILHTIQSGETVAKIAKHYGITADQIIKWNGLKDITRLQIGQQLKLQLKKGAQQQGNLHAGDESREIVASNSKKKVHLRKEPATEKKTNRRMPKLAHYRVRGGDTLWDIAQRFQVTTDEIKEWNNMEDDSIYPGLELVLKVAADAGA